MYVCIHVCVRVYFLGKRQFAHRERFKKTMANGEQTYSPPSHGAADVKVAVEEPEAKRDVPVCRSGENNQKNDVARAVMRVMCMAASAASVSFMVTARQTSTASFYGFQLQLHSVWSLSDSLEYLVGVSSATTVYSLLQLLVSGTRLLRKSPVIPTRNQAWLCFAADQVFGYAMMSGGSAALGVTNMNRTGIKHEPLPNFCKSLDSFCDHVAVSVVFALFGFVLLAASAVLDVIRLSDQ